MDTFDNSELENQPTPAQEPQTAPEPQEPQQPQDSRQAAAPESTYHSAGTGRKESPYANSPYVAQEYQEYRYQPQYQPPKPKKPRNSSGVGRRILSAVLTVALVAGGCGITAAAVNDHWEDRTEETVEELNRKIQALESQIASAPTGGSPVDQPAADGMTPGQLYAQNVHSVVAISSTVQQNTPFGASSGVSSGSGFILSENGYVVTNYHVVENASKVEVITYDSTAYPAEIVGYDASNDLAVLKVEAEGLPAAKIGRSSDLSIGDMVVAIGNPLGTLAATQTVGYVSGINREVQTDSTRISMIQTDAAINPGNSGGPLFNMKGEVIGITTAKYSGTTGSGASIEGIGFAIPIDDVSGMISDLVEFGYVTGAYMGVIVQDTDPETASLYGLPTGAYVVEVTEGGSAHRAGIQVKDIIVGLGDDKVGSITELKRVLRKYKAGDTTTVTVIRSGGEMTMDITFDERPQVMPDPNAQPDIPMPQEGNPDEWYEYYRRFFGK